MNVLRILIPVSALATTFAALAAPPAFEISRSTIDGGGTINSTGGDFELSGTCGQPDAGTMEGGGFELSGGFWFPLAPADCNDDGSVNLFDHAAFESCLTGPGLAVSPGCECFDVDRSGTIDMLDFSASQVGQTGS